MSLNDVILNAYVIEPLKKLEHKAKEVGNTGIQALASHTLEEIERLVKLLHESEQHMGRAADAINQLQSQISTLNSQVSSLQSQITTLQAQPTEDAADVAAINGVLGAPAAPVSPANSNAPAGQTNVSQGTPAGS